MEPLFVTECKFDNKSYYEMVPILRKNPSRNFLIFTPVIILIMIFFLVLWGMSGFRDFSWLIPLPAGCLYFVCFFMEPWLRARSALKAGTKFFKETGFERISFYNDFLYWCRYLFSFTLLQKVFFKYVIIQNNKKIKTGKNLYLIWFKANELSYKEYKLAERKLNI
mgnify:CR=1 FL=1